jgi:hypothetical protein
MGLKVLSAIPKARKVRQKNPARAGLSWKRDQTLSSKRLTPVHDQYFATTCAGANQLK